MSLQSSSVDGGPGKSASPFCPTPDASNIAGHLAAASVRDPGRGRLQARDAAQSGPLSFAGYHGEQDAGDPMEG